MTNDDTYAAEAEFLSTQSSLAFVTTPTEMRSLAMAKLLQDDEIAISEDDLDLLAGDLSQTLGFGEVAGGLETLAK